MAYPISDVPRRIVYSGSAGVGPYAFTFEVLANTDIAVYKNTTLLTLTTDYTVSINTGTGTGTVTLVVAATGADTVTIVGDRAIRRTSDFVTGGDLFANTLNEELDAQTIYTQQVDEKADRAIRAPVTDPTTINMVLPSQNARASKVLGFNAQGNPTQTANTLTSIDAAVTAINQIAAAPAGNSDGITFLQAGSGAVTRTAQAKMRDVVSVKDFGAVGDGVTDDTAALLAAISAQNGKPILLPPGQTFLVSTLGNTTLTTPFFLFGGGVLDGGNSATTGFVLGSGISSIRCEDVTFQNFAAPVFRATAITNTIDAFTFIGNTINNCQKGVYLVCIAKSVVCANNRVSNISHTLDTAAFHFGTNTYSDQDQRERFVITGNNINSVVSTTGGQEAHGIIVYGREAVIANNVIKSVSNPTGANSEAIYTKVRFGLVANNVVTECAGSASANSAFIAVKGSVRSSTAQTQGYGMTLQGNSLFSSSGAHAGIRIESDDCTVTGNYLEGFGGYAIYTSSGSFLNIAITNNTIRNLRGSIAILTQMWGRGLSITGNRIYGLLANQATTGSVYGIRVSNFGGTLDSVIVQNNSIIDDGTSAATTDIYGISMRAGATYTIADPDISNNFVSIAHASIVEYGIDIAASGTISDLTVKGNNLAGVPVSGGYPIITSGTFTGAINIQNNIGWGPLYALGPTTLALYYTDTTFTDVGTSSNRTQNLPAAVAGLTFRFMRSSATYFYRVDPNGTDTIRGGGAGKYLELGSAGATVTLVCIQAGNWEIVAQTGTITFEP